MTYNDWWIKKKVHTVFALLAGVNVWLLVIAAILLLK